MKNGLISIVAIVLSMVAIVSSIFTINKVNKIQKLIGNPSSVQMADDANSDASSNGSSFDTSLVGDWEGTREKSTQYAKMKVLDDGRIIIESQDYSSFNLYIGYIEGGKTVIEQKARLGKHPDYLESHEPGDGIKAYLNNPSSFEMEEYIVARSISKPTSKTLYISYGVVNGGSGEGISILTKE